MLSRLPVVLALASLALLPALLGCSSSHRRDQYFDTDAGTDFQIPDAAGFPSQATDDAGAADLASDTGLGDLPADEVAAGAADLAPDTGLEDLPADEVAQEAGSDIDS